MFPKPALCWTYAFGESKQAITSSQPTEHGSPKLAPLAIHIEGAIRKI